MSSSHPSSEIPSSLTFRVAVSQVVVFTVGAWCSPFSVCSVVASESLRQPLAFPSKARFLEVSQSRPLQEKEVHVFSNLLCGHPASPPDCRRGGQCPSGPLLATPCFIVLASIHMS